MFFFSITQKIIKNFKNLKNKGLVKTLLEYNVLFCYKVTNYKCNRWKALS